MRPPPHTVPRDWEGETVAVVAAGPSLTTFDMSRISGLKTIAVKDGHLLAPNAEVLLIGDHRYAMRRPDLSGYKGELILYTDEYAFPHVWEPERRFRFIPKVAGRGLSRKPTELRGTFTTVALAINYAVLRGSRRILLAGVDGKAGPAGQRHFSTFEAENWNQRYERQAWGYSRLADDLASLKVQVFNLNPDTAVTTFPVLEHGV